MIFGPPSKPPAQSLLQSAGFVAPLLAAESDLRVCSERHSGAESGGQRDRGVLADKLKDLGCCKTQAHHTTT